MGRGDSGVRSQEAARPLPSQRTHGHGNEGQHHGRLRPHGGQHGWGGVGDEAGGGGGGRGVAGPWEGNARLAEGEEAAAVQRGVEGPQVGRPVGVAQAALEGEEAGQQLAAVAGDVAREKWSQRDGEHCGHAGAEDEEAAQREAVQLGAGLRV